jgi:phosphatidate phosphatase APP1
MMRRLGKPMISKERLHRVLHAIEQRLDRRRALVPKTLTAPIAVPYRGFGNREQAWVKGRVLQERGIPRGLAPAGAARNLVHTYRRLASREVPRATVRVTLGRETVELVTDDEGYYEGMISMSGAADAYWQPVEVELLDPAPAERRLHRGSVLLSPPYARFGVVSDIDDTILRTDATRLIRMILKVALHNASTRLPFEGVGAFYRALQFDRGAPLNPIFYVSSGPWNLYDFLEDFFEVHDIPVGPMLLQDFGIDDRKLIYARHDEHKRAQIEWIFSMFPDLPWVLVGDSGQHDPEIYASVVREHAARIRVIYIRAVTTPARDEEVHRIAEETRGLGVEMVLVADTAAAWDHARQTGLLRE